jgi:nitrite reductase/ring-hydroxylating ferredoxin subunit
VTFVSACDVTELQPGHAMRAIAGDDPIALFNVDGRLFATQDRCPHGLWPLSESYFTGDKVECALHGAQFSVISGKRLAPPVCRALKTYAVKVEAGRVYIDVDSGACEPRAGATTEGA